VGREGSSGSHGLLVIVGLTGRRLLTLDGRGDQDWCLGEILSPCNQFPHQVPTTTGDWEFARVSEAKRKAEYVRDLYFAASNMP